MERHRVRRRRASVIVASSLIALGLGLNAAPTANAKADVTSDRVAGNDRFETAADVAAVAFPTGSSKVLIASGRTFPDALSGAALGLPILLTERDTLPSATAQAIDDLHAKDAVILGGTGAVSAAVANEIGHHATVTRIAGNDRYETASKIAQSIGASNVESVGGKKTAIIATGLGYADALAGGPLATGNSGSPVLPILLVNDKVPQSTSDALSALGIKQVLILGGTGAVSTSVESDLKTKTGNQPVRLGGNSRYGTAAVIGDFAIDTLGFPGDKMLLASGAGFADALAGGPLGGVRSAPLLLTDPSKLSDDTKSFFEDHSGTIDRITTLGGTAAVSNSTQSSADAAAQTTPKGGANEVYKIVPSADVNQTNGSSRDYTATGLGGTVVDLVIMPCANVSTADDGRTVFGNADSDTLADRSADPGDQSSHSEPVADQADTPAAITKVNGSDLNADDPTRDSNDYEPDISPVSGTVTFTISGPTAAGAASSCVRPVIFEDANTDNALNVIANSSNPAAPSEKFGTGGQVAFSPGGSGAGQFGNKNITNVDTSRDLFDACAIKAQSGTTEAVDPTDCATFRYDANDTYQRSPNSVIITMAEFEQRVSAGDDVSGTYSDVASGVSTFLLVDEEPIPPAAPSAAADPKGGEQLKWADSSTASVTQYRVYRATTTVSTCPASISGSSLLGTVAATPMPSPPPADPNRYSFTDTSIAESTTYCYNIVPVDGTDDGDPSAGTNVAIPAGPMITSATALTAPSSSVADGDKYQLVFSRPVAATTAATGTITVQSSNMIASYVVDCTGGTKATCTLSADGLTLTVTLKTDSLRPPLSYPLTITATNILGASDSKTVNLKGSDVTIAQPS